MPVVTLVTDRAPCLLPALPGEAVLGAIPDPDNADRFTVTRDGLASLAGYLVGMQRWIAAADKCLEAPQ